MSTDLDYLNDSYRFQSSAVLVDVVRIDQQTVLLVLDRTIFYPQGGGQPSDKGEIYNEQFRFRVDKVQLNEDGIALHYGEIINGKASANQPVQLEIDKELRISHAKIHSAGHLLDAAVANLGLNLSPTKGYHVPDAASVEYQGSLTEPSSYIAALEEACNDIVSSDLEIITVDLEPSQAKAENVWAPPGKSARFVYLDGYRPNGCGCGGTHLRTTQEIGPIKIRKIKSKKGTTRIGYSVE